MFVILAASSGRCRSRLRQPSGSPALWKTSAMAQKHRGDNSDPLRTTVFPVARAKHTARQPRGQGAFLDKDY